LTNQSLRQRFHLAEDKAAFRLRDVLNKSQTVALISMN